MVGFQVERKGVVVSNEEEKEIQQELNMQTQKEKLKFNKKVIIFGLILPLFMVAFIIRLILIAPFVDRDLRCEYSPKFNKFTCIQTGDVVPKWLNINDSNIFGANNYSMKLVVVSKDKDYKTLEMTDFVFITDLPRKFIYEVKEQTIWDYFKFKTMLGTNERSNWGSTALYCSESNLQDSVCKNMKKYAR